MRRARKAAVLDRIDDAQPVFADPRLDAAAHRQVFAHHRRLDDRSLAPERAAIAVPGLAIALEARRLEGAVPVHRIRHLAAQRHVEMIGRTAVRLAHVIEAAGAEQAREAPHETRAAIGVGREIGGAAEAGGGLPGERRAAQVETPDIHAAVDEHREFEPAAGPELQGAHALLGAVREGDEIDPRHLTRRADMAFEVAAGEVLSEQPWHRYFTAPVVRPLTM